MRDSQHGPGSAGKVGRRRWALTVLAPRLALAAVLLNLMLAVLPPLARPAAADTAGGSLLADLAAICTSAGLVAPAADGEAPAPSKPYCIFCLPQCAALSVDVAATAPALLVHRRPVAVLAPARSDERRLPVRSAAPYRTRAPPAADRVYA